MGAARPPWARLDWERSRERSSLPGKVREWLPPCKGESRLSAENSIRRYILILPRPASSGTKFTQNSELGLTPVSDIQSAEVLRRAEPMPRFGCVERVLQFGAWLLRKSPDWSVPIVLDLLPVHATPVTAPKTRCSKESWKSTSSRSTRRWVSKGPRFRHSCTRSSSATCAAGGSSTACVTGEVHRLSP